MSEEYVVHKGIEIPERQKESGVYRGKYPFASMEVGDCLLFDDHDSAKRVHSGSQQYGKKFNVKFAMRSIGDNKYGIWMIK